MIVYGRYNLLTLSYTIEVPLYYQSNKSHLCYESAHVVEGRVEFGCLRQLCT